MRNTLHARYQLLTMSTLVRSCAGFLSFTFLKSWFSETDFITYEYLTELLTQQFNSWTQNDHPLLTSLRNIAQNWFQIEPPSFL